MAKNNVRGTALYCGIDVSLEQMKAHLRLAGEVQIVRMNLPASEKAGKVAHVIPEDLPILEVYLDGQPFRLKVV